MLLHEKCALLRDIPFHWFVLRCFRFLAHETRKQFLEERDKHSLHNCAEKVHWLLAILRAHANKDRHATARALEVASSLTGPVCRDFPLPATTLATVRGKLQALLNEDMVSPNDRAEHNVAFEQ